MPPLINHPARVAERIATLDLVSDGRCEFGTGEGATEVELGGYRVPQEEKRAMWLEGLTVVTRMMVEEPFAGHEGKYLNAPVRNVVPKPLQRPHPPLWLACSRRETILLAARLGLGALTFSFVSPEESRQWVRDYYSTLENECEPIGYDVNPQIAITCPFLCDRDETRVRELSAENHGFFMYGSATTHSSASMNLARPTSGTTTRPDQSSNFRTARRQNPGLYWNAGSIARSTAGVRGLGRRPGDFLSQAGRIPHEILSSSIELFGKEVLPEVKERDHKRANDKAAAKQRIVEKAMARKRKPEVPDWPPTVVRAAGHH